MLGWLIAACAPQTLDRLLGGDDTATAAVDDTGEDAGAVPGADGDAEAFFAEGTLHDLAISLPPDSRANLERQPRVWVPATLIEDNTSWPVDLMLKGTSSFRDLSGKAGFKISFVHTNPDARFHGLKRLTLNAMIQDASMLHEHTAYWLYRRFGIPAPRHTYTRLSVDGEDFGLHGVVETADEQFLGHQLPDDHHGNLYEANVSDFATGRTAHFEIEETDGLWEPYTDIDEAIAALDSSHTSLLETLGNVFDVDALLGLWAIELVTTNPDGYAFNANNYLAYHGVADRWFLMPWGSDQGFVWYRDVTDTSPFRGVLIARCEADPECHQRLEGAMLDLLDVWEEGDLAAMVDAETAVIQRDCEADARAPLACDTASTAAFVRDRPATVRQELGVQ